VPFCHIAATTFLFPRTEQRFLFALEGRVRQTV
jgi:hypothetical protein